MKSVEQFITELKAYKGVENVLVNERLSNDKLSDFWYGGLVIGFDYGNYNITIKAVGDIDCMAQIKGEEDEIWLRDKSNGGNVGTELIDYGVTKDSDITYDLLEFETTDKKCYLDFANGNNNWIEIIAYDKTTNQWLENYESFGLEEIIDMDVKEIIDFALDYTDKISE